MVEAKDEFSIVPDTDLEGIQPTKKRTNLIDRAVIFFQKDAPTSNCIQSKAENGMINGLGKVVPSGGVTNPEKIHIRQAHTFPNALATDCRP